MALRAGDDKTLVCEYAKLTRRVDVEKKLFKLLRTTYAKAGKTKQEVLQTIEDLDIEIQRREETMIRFRQKLSVIPESFDVPESNKRN